MPARITLLALLFSVAVAAAEPDAPPAAAPGAADAGSAEEAKPSEPFAFADFSWMNGNSHTTESPIDTKYFTGEFRVDTSYIFDFAHPADHSLTGTSESGRTDEFQVQQLGLGGDFHYDNVIGRLMTQFGMYSTMTPRNDASPSIGQWDLTDAYRYISEAYGGYHLNVMHGINIEAGIFMSYIGLFSYYNADNWAYQPSYVSSNTPWFFNGARIQFFPTDTIKIEPWLINGWQSYGKFNSRPGLGMQILYRPTGRLAFVSNNYAYGTDAVGQPNRNRWHTDDSVEILKYYDQPNQFFDKSAFSLTLDLGCENGGGVVCAGGHSAHDATATTPAEGPLPDQYFAGFMLYDRLWFWHDKLAVTIGGGAMTNPGRYLVLMPPINGATAASGTPYFTENPGDKFQAWDGTVTFDWMPSQFITFRFEYNHRASSVPYFSGPGGVTPPGQGSVPSGTPTPVGSAGSEVPGWAPDLRTYEDRINFALLVKL